MKSINFYIAGLLGATVFLGASLIGGCNSTKTTPQHPDEVDSVVRALTTNGFGTINVSQDRTKGVMALTGSAQSQERKMYAEQIARVNASDYVIADQITVTPPPPTVAQLTEDKFKAVLEDHKNLDLQDISYKAEDGTLVLSGNVHSAHERAETVRLAKSVPNVERVVDQIKVER